jgi:hypothetical protein
MQELYVVPNWNKGEYDKKLNKTWYTIYDDQPVPLPKENRLPYSARTVGSALHKLTSCFLRGITDSDSNYELPIREAAQSTHTMIVDEFSDIFQGGALNGKTYIGSEIQLKNPEADDEIIGFFAQKRGFFLNLVSRYLSDPEQLVRNQRLPIKSLLAPELAEIHQHLIPFRIKNVAERNSKPGYTVLYEPTAIADLIGFSNRVGDRHNDFLCRSAAEMCNSNASLHNLSAIQSYTNRYGFRFREWNGQDILQQVFENCAKGEIVMTVGEIKSVHGAIASYIDRNQFSVINNTYHTDISHTTMALRETLEVAFYNSNTNVNELWPRMLDNMQFFLFFQTFLNNGREYWAGRPVTTRIASENIMNTMEIIPKYAVPREFYNGDASS